MIAIDSRFFLCVHALNLIDIISSFSYWRWAFFESKYPWPILRKAFWQFVLNTLITVDFIYVSCYGRCSCVVSSMRYTSVNALNLLENLSTYFICFHLFSFSRKKKTKFPSHLCFVTCKVVIVIGTCELLKKRRKTRL